MNRTDILSVFTALVMTTIGLTDHFVGLGLSEEIGAFYTFGGLSGLAIFAFFCFLKAASVAGGEDARG